MTVLPDCPTGVDAPPSDFWCLLQDMLGQKGVLKQALFIDSFLQNNRLEHIHQVMGYHPSYLEAFLKTQSYILREDGPLPFPHRHYIAIMAAARHQCLYLVRLHAHEFVLNGGDPQWLRGLEHAPPKLRSLCPLINILAHQPWLIKPEHIQKLTKGSQESWSLSELAQAIVIITHFNSLSSFVFGCGIVPEVDMGGCSPSSSSPSSSSLARQQHSSTSEEDEYASDNSSSSNTTETNANSVLEETSIASLMVRMKQLSDATDPDISQDELAKRFELLENQSLEISVPKSNKTWSRSEDLTRFTVDSDFSYSDFAKRPPGFEIPTFRIQDYSWEDQGFSLANRLYSDIGNLLEERFNTTFNLTYFTMGDNEEVDTRAFRMAIWYYIQCMFGIRHDDYDYAQVNQLLERSLKAYIKTVTCYPERLTKKDFEGVMRSFKHSEKVHVNLMITEARMQAELLYALRAFNRYLTEPTLDDGCDSPSPDV